MSTDVTATDYAMWNELTDLFGVDETGSPAATPAQEEESIVADVLATLSLKPTSSLSPETPSPYESATDAIQRYVAFARETGDARTAARAGFLAACPGCDAHAGAVAVDHTCVSEGRQALLLLLVDAGVTGYDEFNHATGWRWRLPASETWTAVAPPAAVDVPRVDAVEAVTPDAAVVADDGGDDGGGGRVCV